MNIKIREYSSETGYTGHRPSVEREVCLDNLDIYAIITLHGNVSALEWAKVKSNGWTELTEQLYQTYRYFSDRLPSEKYESLLEDVRLTHFYEPGVHLLVDLLRSYVAVKAAYDDE